MSLMTLYQVNSFTSKFSLGIQSLGAFILSFKNIMCLPGHCGGLQDDQPVLNNRRCASNYRVSVTSYVACNKGGFSPLYHSFCSDHSASKDSNDLLLAGQREINFNKFVA